MKLRHSLHFVTTSIIKTSYFYSLFLLLGTCIRVGDGVFRFCHRGMWHEFQEGDCPFGLLFNERINAPCFYTLNENSSARYAIYVQFVPYYLYPSFTFLNNIFRIWPTICDDTPFLSSSHEKNLGILGQDFVLAQKNGKVNCLFPCSNHIGNVDFLFIYRFS